MYKKMWAAVAACLGLLVAGAVVAQPPKADHPADLPKGIDALTAVLGDSRTALGKWKDYTCTFTRQESRGGKLSGEEVAEMKVRLSPAGVYVRFAKPDEIAGMEVAYSARKNPLKIRYRAGGGGVGKGFHTIDLDDTKFMGENRHPVTEWTMAAVLDRVSAAVAREKTLNNRIEVYTGEYQFAGRSVIRYEVLTPVPHAFRYAHRVLVFADKETKLPVRFEAYDQPKSGGTVGDLLEAYSYSDVKMNVTLGESAFDY